jgi:hypothetical protein
VRSVTHVTLEHHGDDELVVNAWVGDKLMNDRMLTASEISCREGRSVYHNTGWGVGGLAPFFPMIGHASNDSMFSRASDGTLVVEDQGVITGVALVFPMAFKVQDWSRFPRTSPVSTGL